MAKSRNIGATLSLKSGNFFANMKKAQNESNNLRSTLNNTSKKISELGDKAKVVGSAVGKLGKGLADRWCRYIVQRQFGGSTEIC